jgi:uncharacterized membrane protein
MESVEALIRAVSEAVILLVDVMAIVAVLFGSVQAFVSGLRWLLSPTYAAGMPIRHVWMRYARWLIAALTFQLAADIVETAIAPTTEAILHLGAIAVIRTFLNYFLERDMHESVGEHAPRGQEHGDHRSTA